MDWLINWIWQGCMLTVAVGVCLKVRWLSASTREIVWRMTLGLILLMPIISGAWRDFLASTLSTDTSAFVVLDPVVMLPPSQAGASVLIWAWLGWVVVSGVRLAAGAATLARIKQRCTPVPRDRQQRLLYWMQCRTQGRPATLAVSTAVPSAAVLGFGSPVIALNPVTLDHLSDDDLDYVVLHELAHVQRRDDLSGVFLALVRAVAGMHPAVWWISRELVAEREVACDDWVVSLTNRPKRYASCLANIAELTRRGAPLAPAVASHRSQLAMRIARLLDVRPNRSRQRSNGAVGMLFTAQVLSTASLLAVEPVGVRQFEDIAARSVGAALESRHLIVATLAGPLSAFPIADAPGAADPGPVTVHASTDRAVGVEFARQAPAVTTSRQTREPEPPAPVEGSAPSTSPPPITPQNVSHEPSALLASRTLGGLPHTPSPPRTTADGLSPWEVAATTGVVLGQASRTAGVSTARFFTRAAKSIAGAF